jgi:metal-sulfur cluster biosynthetic enzyme
MIDKEDVYLALSDVYDPEIRINIVALGLIYMVEIEADKINIEMTLTAPNCPASPEIRNNVIKTLKQLKGINDVNLNVVWEPAWEPSMMSEEAKLDLGYDVFCENERKW